MGKVRRARQKLHASAPSKTSQLKDNDTTSSESKSQLPIAIESDLFAGINIDVSRLNKTLKQDDTVTVKSFKSTKSEMFQGKLMTKKDKLKLRREILLKKVDTVNQLKKERQKRKKRENCPIIGDTNPLRDALPSLESLLKAKDSYRKTTQHVKRKSIQKSSKRKKDLLHGVTIYKKLLKNKDLNKNPLDIVSEHVKQMAQNNEKK